MKWSFLYYFTRTLKGILEYCLVLGDLKRTQTFSTLNLVMEASLVPDDTKALFRIFKNVLLPLRYVQLGNVSFRACGNGYDVTDNNYVEQYFLKIL